MSSPSKTTTSTTEGGGSSTTTSSPLQQPYYKQLIGQANNLYQQGLPNYYGGATVAGFTPAQMESMNQSSNWTTDGAQNMMGNVNQNFQQMMSGQVQTGEGTPWQGMSDAYTRQATDQANKLMQNVRSSQVMSGQPGGSSRGDLLNNQVIDAANEQVSNNLAAMYGNAYTQAQQTQSNALGQYGSIMSMPLQMSQALYNQVGLPQQQLNQALMNDAKQRYDYSAMRPWQNLSQFGNFLQGNMGGTNSTGSSSWSTSG